MPLKKTAKFIAALVLGFILTLSSYPAYSQDFPEFQQCSDEINSYPDYSDLDQYNEHQVYCLTVSELIGGGIDVTEEYDDSVFEQLVLTAFEDIGDAQDDDPTDDKLTYAEIRDEFSGDELRDLIEDAIDEADQQSRLFQLAPLQVAVDSVMSKSIQPSSLKQHEGKGRIQGGAGVNAIGQDMSRRRGCNS